MTVLLVGSTLGLALDETTSSLQRRAAGCWPAGLPGVEATHFARASLILSDHSSASSRFSSSLVSSSPCTYQVFKDDRNDTLAANL
jgi:hypothetical protein